MTKQTGAWDRTRGIVSKAGTFRCEGCMGRYDQTVRHRSGFCSFCIGRGRRYWLQRYTWDEIHDLAACLWPDEDRVVVAARSCVPSSRAVRVATW